MNNIDLPLSIYQNIMVNHLATIMIQNLKLYPGKWWVLYHCSPHMIMSKNNEDYNIHWQVEFGAYVQTSEVNDLNNTNNLKTLDGIYLWPAPNLQGRHQIMKLLSGKLTKTPKVVDRPITYFANQQCWKMAEGQEFKSLKKRTKKSNSFPWCQFVSNGTTITNITDWRIQIQKIHHIRYLQWCDWLWWGYLLGRTE